eukprot:TRINITY_DN2557_c0_g1_i2.p1 TRINITY_DN2557_c0_g1~~TRINITY_DN2557_c0_g1_i2.p1  ORF type:complete len:238 (-),score=27.68 TRINITY_DN2557_c0_g1_i2:231-944(-)
MLEEDVEREMKMLVIGNGGVGKTSMIRKFCHNSYSDDYKKTIGVDFLEKHINLPDLGEDVRLFLWDTAGQEEFDALTRSYYRGAKAAVLVYSVTDRESFESIKQWHKRIKEECGNIPIALVQNKVDLLDRARVSVQESEELARQLGLRFYRTCVKEGLNVVQVFQYLAMQAIEMENNQKINGSQHLSKSMGKNDNSQIQQQQSLDNTRQSVNQVINLTVPSKRRTGGKKQKMTCMGS